MDTERLLKLLNDHEVENKMKKAAGRSKDKEDLKYLERIKEKKISDL
jgi:hypothetical protein